jgi:hypothetical protein
MNASYNLKNIRLLLMESFSEDELRRFCFDVPGFRDIHYDLTSNNSKSEIVDKIIEYADRKLIIENLLSGVKSLNPARYEAHKPYEISPGFYSTSKMVKGQIDILFLAANPIDSNRLRLDMEIREIDQALQKSEYGSRFRINQHWAVRIDDLQEYLLRHNPKIVHFSGHGSPFSEIVLEDHLGNSRSVPPQALSNLFSLLKDNVKCVVLNACYSAKQAKAIAKHIDYVIGMSKAIDDAAAIKFAKGFYQALGYGKSIEDAFNLGKIEVNLTEASEQDIPKLLTSKNHTQDLSLIGND